MARLASLSFAVLALVACKEKNPQFCEGHPTDPRCVDDGDVDAGIDAITSCTNSDQCTDPDLGVCDPTSGGCVECTATETAACTGTSPVCGADHECRGCQRDEQQSARRVMAVGRDDGQRHRSEHCNTRREAVFAIDQVERVGEEDDPEQRRG